MIETARAPHAPRPLVGALAGAVLAAAATTTAAAAQDFDPESGDTTAVQAPPLDDPTTEGEAAADGQAADADAPGGDAGDADDGDSDHAGVVGRFGVGFFGVREVVSGPVNTATGALTTVSAPSIGVRHWLDARIGVEAALGLGFSSRNVDADGDGRNLGRVWGLVLHGAVPIALYHRSHYAFLVIPETNLGLAGGSARSNGGDDAYFGVLWDLGVRLGAELHFGFIGVPDLSLQASVGVRLRVTHGRETLCDADTACDTTTENRATRVDAGTTVEGDPWDIFTGAITAIYYF